MIIEKYEKIIEDLLIRLEKTTNALNESMKLSDRYYKSIERKYKTIEKLREDSDPEYIGALHKEIGILRDLKDNYIEQLR